MATTRRLVLLSVGGPLVFAAAAALPLLQGCKTANSSGSGAQGFGWDQDVADPTTKPGDLPATATSTAPPPTLDSNFCKGLLPGTCLTLVLRIPKADLVQDLGLSTLALGASSRAMRSRLDEACQAAWLDYKTKYQADKLHQWRQRLVVKTVKMRCVYQFMSEEVVLEDSKLATNEIGFSVRLTKFNLSGSDFSGDVRSVGVQLKNTFVQGAFRNTSLFIGKDLGAKTGGWLAVASMGVTPLDFKQAMSHDINWHVDWPTLQHTIEQVAKQAPGASAGVSAFFSQAKSAVGQIAAAGNPAAASVLMIGMGYNAYRSLCGENAAECKVSASSSDMTAGVNHDLVDLVPSSETNELFRLAVIRTVQGVLDQIMTRADVTQLTAMIGSN